MKISVVTDGAVFRIAWALPASGPSRHDHDRFHAAMNVAAKSPGVDRDQLGLYWATHDEASAAAAEALTHLEALERMRWS